MKLLKPILFVLLFSFGLIQFSRMAILLSGFYFDPKVSDEYERCVQNEFIEQSKTSESVDPDVASDKCRSEGNERKTRETLTGPLFITIIPGLLGAILGFLVFKKMD